MKKLLAILLAAIMLLSLAACGNTDNPDPSETDNPGVSQTHDQGAFEPSNTPNPPSNNTSLEAPWFGWSEDDIKPDTGFAGIEAMDNAGWFISLTEPLTEDTYKAWYAKLVSKIENFADNSEYIIQNVTDLDASLNEAINTFNAGGGALYIMFEYKVGDMTIGVTTGVTNFEDTEDVLYFYLREIE